MNRISFLSLKCLGVFTSILGTGLDANAQIPNADFETWNDCMPAEWASPNVCGMLTPISKSSTPHTGASAVRGEVVSFFGQTIAPFIQSGEDATGFPISERYETVGGFYTFQPFGGDRFAINVAFYLGEDVVAQGAMAITAGAASYTAFKVNMSYVSQVVPDRALISFSIIGPVTGSDYHVGSVMQVDSLSFDSSGGTVRPSLEIQKSGNAVIVSWPSNVTNFKLQGTSSLINPTWTDVQGVEGNSYQTTPTGQMFFRLIQI